MKKLLVFILVFSFAIAMCACQRLEQELGGLLNEGGDDFLSGAVSGFGSVVAGDSDVAGNTPEETTPLTYEEMTTADRWEINTVLSHFVDTGLRFFDRNSPSETDLFRFAQSNAYYHNYHKIQLSGDGQYYYLTADDVAATLAEYFDIAVEQPLPVSEPTFYQDEAYFWPCADGDFATEFASLNSLSSTGEDGMYQVGFDVYSPYDLFTMEIEGYYSFSHKDITARDDLMHVGSGTALISYKDGQCIIYSIQVAG